MPKVYENVYGTSRAKGNFLASEVGKRLETRDFTPLVNTLGVEETNANGEVVKVIKKGKVCPTNTTKAQGIVFEDVYPDAEGHYIGSLMTGGYVWKERLEDEIDSAAVTTLKALGLYVVEHPETVRPNFGSNNLKKLTPVQYVRSSGSGENGFEVEWHPVDENEINHTLGIAFFANGKFISAFEPTESGKLNGVGNFNGILEANTQISAMVLGDYEAYSNSDIITGIVENPT